MMLPQRCVLKPWAMDITVGPLVNLWGFGPDKQPVQIPRRRIDAAKLNSGAAAPVGDSNAKQQYLQKICQIFVCRSLHCR